MNLVRLALGSIVLASGSGMLFLACQPVLASVREERPVAPSAWTAFVHQEAAKKQPSKAIPKDDIPLPDGEGKETTKKLCGNCHSTDVWVQQRHTPEKWSSIVDNMISKGMEASDDDLAVVNDYLGKYLAPPPKDAPPATPPQ